MRAAVLLIDGRSGSGKTELARAVVAGVPEAQLVRLDDLYPGWGGLEEGSRVWISITNGVSLAPVVRAVNS